MELSTQQGFITHMKDVQNFYTEFLELENGKYEDILEDKLDVLDQHMKKEEVFLLRARGLEQERERLLAQMELQGCRMTQVIDAFDEPQKSELKQVFGELSAVLLDLKEVNLRCNSLSELKLHRIVTILEQIEQQPELQKAYTEQAQKAQKQGSLVSKKI